MIQVLSVLCFYFIGVGIIILIQLRYLFAMYRFLSKLTKLSTSVSKEKMRLKVITEQLCQMFQTDSNRTLLTSLFQILPIYFTKKHVEQFAKSSNINQYIEYINNKTPDKKKFREFNNRYLQQNKQKSIINCRNAIFLEAYLHWLTKQYSSFNAENNQYFLEYVHLQNPQKLYETFTNNEKRVFIYHHGPTNSGKSTSAIQQLKSLPHTEKGIYMAPLRLLAWQYHKKLGNCSLITGQEKEYKNSNLTSCTIQATNLNEEYSVAVIDQIQMIADQQRGWAWTKTILALKAKRIHLCGDERALRIISELVKESGDCLEERKYSRLSKLILIHKNFKLQKLEAGDCIIDFSKNKLIKHRDDINKMMMEKLKAQEQEKKNAKSRRKNMQEQVQNQTKVTNNYAAIIYGKLPPECRKEQANLFNNQQLPYLVATNAIGMGLNLNIKKIIFTTIQKPSSGGKKEQLQDHQIQQIAGRAGRGKQNGYVQCVNNDILQRVKKALSKVNKQYGIQLENQQDQNEQTVNMNDVQPVQKARKSITEVYNVFLGRQMTQKEGQIKKACFYFPATYLIEFKLRMRWLMGIDFGILDQIQFLKKYSKLNNLYFYQSTKHMGYLVKLLQQNQFDLKDLLLFYNGLSLSIPPPDFKRLYVNRVKSSHRLFIKSFIKNRRVPLPSFLVNIYKQNNDEFQFMEQISQLQVYYNLLETYVWLWNKYQFAFYEVTLAKQIKIFLQKKISTILRQNKLKTARELKSQLKNQVQSPQSVPKIQLQIKKNQKTGEKINRKSVIDKNNYNTQQKKSKQKIKRFFKALLKSKSKVLEKEIIRDKQDNKSIPKSKFKFLNEINTLSQDIDGTRKN